MKLSIIRMAFSCGVCVCGLGGVYVGVIGVGNLCCIGQGSLKNWGSNPPKVIGFAKFSTLVGQFLIGKINPKSRGCLPNLCTYLVINLSLKIRKCISTK